MPIERLQLVWRNTTQPGRCDPRQRRELLDAVREVDGLLPRERRLRVLAGDSPIDWEKVRRPEKIQAFLNRRDRDFAGVVEREVLARHRKALLVIGAGHLLHHPITWRNFADPQAPSVSMILEKAHPHSVFVIIPHDGYRAKLPEFEARFAPWTPPSLVKLQGTWLGAVAGKVVFGANIRRGVRERGQAAQRADGNDGRARTGSGLPVISFRRPAIAPQGPIAMMFARERLTQRP